MDNKLPSKEFDPIYETCNGTHYGYGKQSFINHIGDYSRAIFAKVYNSKSHLSYNQQVANAMEAYRTGEIRDRGAMTTRVRVLVGWEKGTEVDVVDYEFPSGESGWKTAVPDADGDYVVRSKTSCEIVTDEPILGTETLRKIKEAQEAPLWYQLDPAKFDGLVDKPDAFQKKAYGTNYDLWSTYNHIGIHKNFDVRQIGLMMISQYKAGILRQGGPLEVCETCGRQV